MLCLSLVSIYDLSINRIASCFCKLLEEFTMLVNILLLAQIDKLIDLSNDFLYRLVSYLNCLLA